MDPQALGQQLVLGLSRRPWVDPDGLSAPDRVALLAARSRFTRPLPPTLSTPPPSPLLDLRLVPDALREDLARLFQRGADLDLECAGLRLAQALAGSGLALHPFDYPRLRSWIARSPVPLDVHATRWAKDDAAAEPASGESITGETWHEFPVRERVDFLGTLRLTDRVRAEGLLNEAFDSESAATRAKLLGALEVALGPDDESFLTERLGDRAKSVVTAAARLLGRIPGTPAFESRIDAIGEVLTVQTRGLLRRRPVVVVTTPDKLDEIARWHWLADQLGGLDPRWLARRLELPEGSLADAAQDRHLRALWLLESLRAGQLDLAEALAADVDAGVVLYAAQSEAELLRKLPADAARRATALLCGIRRTPGVADLHHALATVYPLTRASLGEDDARALIESRLVADFVRSAETADNGEQILLDLTAVLDPATRVTWRDRLAGLPTSVTLAADALVRLLDGLESSARAGPDAMSPEFPEED